MDKKLTKYKNTTENRTGLEPYNKVAVNTILTLNVYFIFLSFDWHFRKLVKKFEQTSF